LEYDGFSDMQRVFRSLLVSRSSNYRDRIETLRRQSEAGAADPGAVLADSVDESIHALQLLGEHTAPGDLDRAIELLTRARDIYVMAERRAFPVAFYLAYAIGRLEQTVHLLDGVGGMLRQQTRNIRLQDAVIVVSFPPYSPTVVDLLSKQHRRGVAAVAITDSPVSPIALEGHGRVRNQATGRAGVPLAGGPHVPGAESGGGPGSPLDGQESCGTEEP
jgi:DNA-binding MurR/RpiR family transcriptional regulator